MPRAAQSFAAWVAAAALVAASPGSSAAAGAEAREILDATGVKGGLVVHVGCGPSTGSGQGGNLTAALRADGRYLVHGLARDAAGAAKAREHIQKLGLYGVVSVERWPHSRLPYAGNLVNLVVSEDLGGTPMGEVMRVLAPGGVAYVRRGGQWARTVKPWPKDIDQWTHYLHDATNNAVAKDTVVAPPKRMQWVARPLYGRSHEIDTTVCALVSANGRAFYILDEGLTGITDPRLPQTWSLVARDAFNGVRLWKRPIERWGWPEWKNADLAGKDWTGFRGQRTRSPIALPRRLVAVGDRVYVTLGYNAPLTILDAATGQVLRDCQGTEGTDEIVCDRGVAVLCVRKTPLAPVREPAPQPAKAAAKQPGKKAAKRRRGRSSGTPPPASLVAVQADTGRVLWRRPPGQVLPMSLAAADGRAFFHNHKEIVCLDLKTGQPRWRATCQAARGGFWNSSCTLVVQRGVVLLLSSGKLEALSAADGAPLWQGRGGRGPGVANPPDLFVAGGLVWAGASRSGLDPKTGQVKHTLDLQKVITPGHHYRCYRSKATERYLLWPKRGVEFLDVRGANHMRQDWLRPPCRYGVMPCNGMLYVPPSQCFCYPGVRLQGFNALSPGPVEPPKGTGDDTRLERGPAYGHVGNPESGTGDGDWPTLRHDAKRSGSTKGPVPADVRRLWQVEVGGRITQPVLAGGRLYVASVDAHTVHALEAAGGRRLWSYTAGGRVDSPPTIHRGMVLFGSADGWAYCLRAADGELAWRFRGAPTARRIVAFGQVESAWPVHGNVLVKDGVVFFAAGRSSYLDGGIHVYGLDPATGKVLHRARLDGPHPDIAKDVGRPFDMDGTLADVLVTDGERIYMRQVMFDARLRPRDAPRLSRMGDREMGLHLTATGGLLDDCAWNRTFWTYCRRWPGYYIANQSPKAGQLLVFDEATTYGVKCYTRRNRHSPMFFPGTDGYLLFADDNRNEPVLVGEAGTGKPIRWLPAVNKAIGHKLDMKAVNADKGTGFTRAAPPKWAKWVPVRVRAMVLAGETLFVAGPPDVLDAADPLAAFEARKGAVLRAVSAADGRKLRECKLDSPPVFDGLIAAGGRLYLADRSGRVLCLGAK